MRKRSPHIISANEAGQHAFCPEASRLSFLGTKANKTAQKKMSQGTKIHEEWAHQAPRHRSNMLLIAILILIALLAFALIWGKP